MAGGYRSLPSAATTRRTSIVAARADAAGLAHDIVGHDVRDDAYLPLKALSTYAGLSVRTLRRYLSDPAAPLPCYRIGGKVLVKRSEYDRWAQRFRSAEAGGIDDVVGELMRGFS